MLGFIVASDEKHKHQRQNAQRNGVPLSAISVNGTPFRCTFFTNMRNQYFFSKNHLYSKTKNATFAGIFKKDNCKLYINSEYNEKNISTVKKKTRQQAWLPHTYGNQEWSQGIGSSPLTRSLEIDCQR